MTFSGDNPDARLVQRGVTANRGVHCRRRRELGELRAVGVERRRQNDGRSPSRRSRMRRRSPPARSPPPLPNVPLPPFMPTIDPEPGGTPGPLIAGPYTCSASSCLAPNCAALSPGSQLTIRTTASTQRNEPQEYALRQRSVAVAGSRYGRPPARVLHALQLDELRLLPLSRRVWP